MNPGAKDKAFIWKWDDIEPLTVRAGQEVAMEDAERRAVIMCHPAFDGKIETTSNLFPPLQFWNPVTKRPLIAIPLPLSVLPHDVKGSHHRKWTPLSNA